MTEFVMRLTNLFFNTPVVLNKGVTVHCLWAGHQLSLLLGRYAEDKRLFRRHEMHLDRESRNHLRDVMATIAMRVDLLPYRNESTERQRQACLDELAAYSAALAK